MKGIWSSENRLSKVRMVYSEEREGQREREREKEREREIERESQRKRQGEKRCIL